MKETMPTVPEVSTPLGHVASIQRHPSSTSGTPTGIVTPKNFISPSTSRRPRGVLTSTSNNVLSYTTENDDAAEKKQRRRSQVLVMQRQYESPGTPQDRRRSLPTSGMSNAQLADHYANCIKLSAENKINAKNAFGLHLIDHMAEVLKEKKGELNFQVASCTLDASAKIYAGRVDAIHAETYKIMGGLGHGDKNKGGDPGDGSQDTQTTKKKKRRHCNTVEANLSHLNCNKIDPGFEVDPFFHKMSAAFDEGGTFGLLLNHLHRRGDCSELILDSRCSMPTSVDVEHKDQTTQTNVDLKEFKDMFSAGASRMESLQICPQFTDFEFTKWNQDGEDTLSSMMSKLASSEQAFDVHAAPEPLEDPMMEDFAAPPLADADDFSDDDVMAGDMTCVGGAGEQTMFIADGSEAKMFRSGCTSASTVNGSASQLCLQMSLEPTEYSYFNMKELSTWAGPQHWNFRQRPQGNTAGSEGGKKTRAKKEPFRINFQVEMDEKPFSTSRAATTLSKQTLIKYKKTSTVLPEDVHYNPDKLFKLFSKSNYIVKRQYEVSGAEVDDDVGGYDYDNANDCANFCPNMEADDYDDDVGSGLNDFSAGPSDGSQTLGFSSFGNESIFDATVLQGDKLVAQPHKVAKIDITYAKTAKRMDVKKLKTLMWGNLVTPDQQQENAKEAEPKSVEPESEQSNDGVAGLKSFRNIYDSLPEQLSHTLAKNLSVPIAFVCLLHLANEKCLKITRKEESEDLVIVQDSQ